MRISLPLFVLLLVGGGFWFLSNYQIRGLDQVSVHKRSGSELDTYDSFAGDVYDYSANDPVYEQAINSSAIDIIPHTDTELVSDPVPSELSEMPRMPVSVEVTPPPALTKKLRIASWALSGFGNNKLANDVARRNLVRVIRQFDIVALQQVSSIQRDLIPRLVSAINEGSPAYDFILGDATGADQQPEQLAFLFNTSTVQVDRSQTYTVADPHQRLTYDPLVGWFRARGASEANAWTFSLVNVRVDLGRAQEEVATLQQIFSSVRADGRGEDDVIMLGLFQADDAYLIPSIAGQNIVAAVRSVPTDIFNKHQTCNLLMNSKVTSEYLGRGGVWDFLRKYNLTASEAETVSSHLPVYGEFTSHEGGKL